MPRINCTRSARARRTSRRLTGRVLGICVGVVLAWAPVTSFADTNFDCEPIRVLERSNRVDVRCLYPFVGGNDILNIDWVYWLTFPKTDPAQMERFLAMATTALVEGKYFSVDVPTMPDGNISGCQDDDCRTVSTPFGLRNK